MLAPDESSDKQGDLELDWPSVEPDRRKTVPEHDIPSGVFESASAPMKIEATKQLMNCPHRDRSRTQLV